MQNKNIQSKNQNNPSMIILKKEIKQIKTFLRVNPYYNEVPILNKIFKSLQKNYGELNFDFDK